MRGLKTAYALAEKQHGVLARYQLVAELGRVAAEDVLATDRFQRLETGVYRVRGGACLPYQAAFAAALRARPKAVVTGPVALGLHAVPGWVGATDFEVLVAPGRRLRAAAFPVRTESSRLQGNLRFGEVRVAGAVDALIASAALRGERDERDLRIAWDHIRWNGLGRPALLDRRLGELSDTEGARLLRAVLDASGGTRVEGEGERRLAPVLGCFEPAFEPQVWVTPRRRVDFFSHPCRFGVEYLGRVDHGTVAARIADDERDRELRREGIRLRYVTARDLDDPTALLATLSGALTVRAHELGVRPPVAVRPVAGATA